jgi:hypothetical protein
VVFAITTTATAASVTGLAASAACEWRISLCGGTAVNSTSHAHAIIRNSESVM